MTIPAATDLPVLELGSDPYERGLVHGRELAGAIAENVETYLAHFAVSGLDAGSARREGHDWIEVTRRQNPEYAEEMRGIADGSGLPLADVVMLNVRYEITFGLFLKESREADNIAVADGTDGSAVAGLRRCHTQRPQETPPIMGFRMGRDADTMSVATDYFDGWQELTDATPYKNPYRYGWERFIAHVVADAPFPARLSAGIRDVQLAEACQASVATGAWIEMPPLTEDIK